MKSEHRHQLQQNELANWLTVAVEWCQRNAPLLMGVVIGLALTFAAITYFRMRSQEGTLDEWNEFFSAAGRQDVIKLESIARSGGDVSGQLANLMLADTALNNGVEQMSTNRIEAENQLNDAKNKYSDVRNRAEDPLLQQRATLGLARYYETVGLLDEAKKEYEKLAGQPDGMYTEMAQEKIALLNEPGVQSFSTWYQKFKPRPPEPSFNPHMPSRDDLNKVPEDESSMSRGTPPAAETETSAAGEKPSATEGNAAAASGPAPTATAK